MSELLNILGLESGPKYDPTKALPSDIVAMGQSLVDHASQFLPGTSLTVTYEVYPDNFRIEFWVDGFAAGFFRASTRVMGGGSDQYLPVECVDSWKKLGEPPFWVVRAAGWYDDRLYGKNLGFLAYKILFEWISRQGGAVAPDYCSGGDTSDDALKVWKRLRQIYPTEGPFIDLRS